MLLCSLDSVEAGMVAGSPVLHPKRPNTTLLTTQLLADYFTSMLVLSSAFKFRPVVGQEYYLYRMNEDWSLSLIAPSEWSSERRQAYVGQCELHADMTWTIRPSDDLANRESTVSAIADFHEAFVAKLKSDIPLEEMLPTYVAKFSYYQRLFASALSRSLRFKGRIQIF